MDKMAKILIIDDDPNFVEATKAILENKSYKVVAAYDKNEGMEKINSEKPDLILLDIMMKKMDDGFTLCYKLKHDPELKKIPVMAISAITGEAGLKFSSETDGEYFEADDYVEKPVKADDLLERIEKLLKK
ncbi:MAG: response regulator [Actinomycetia bacterium]|nr:response regulator [Actinomycetes bacterium]